MNDLKALLDEILRAHRPLCLHRDQTAAEALEAKRQKERTFMEETARPALETARETFAALPEASASLTENRNGALTLTVQDGSYVGRIVFQPLRACGGREGIRYEIDTAFRKKSHWLTLEARVPDRNKALKLVRKFSYWLYNSDEPPHLATVRDRDPEDRTEHRTLADT
ncbi:MAG TPA: hypothetical protein VG796_24020 [Verrucomicrobiales bacterium]|nr:hypothetical protein [Verrucomicrobiales bacterium]